MPVLCRKAPRVAPMFSHSADRPKTGAAWAHVGPLLEGQEPVAHSARKNRCCLRLNNFRRFGGDQPSCHCSCSCVRSIPWSERTSLLCATTWGAQPRVVRLQAHPVVKHDDHCDVLHVACDLSHATRRVPRRAVISDAVVAFVCLCAPRSLAGSR